MSSEMANMFTLTYMCVTSMQEINGQLDHEKKERKEFLSHLKDANRRCSSLLMLNDDDDEHVQAHSHIWDQSTR